MSKGGLADKSAVTKGTRVTFLVEDTRRDAADLTPLARTMMLTRSVPMVPCGGVRITSSADTTCLVVPCYNEASRLQGDAFLAFVEAHSSVHILFVNDGSSDGTLAMLQTLCAKKATSLRVLDKQPNGGKAEAVRVGMNAAMQGDTEYGQLGFWDADLATPLEALPHLLGKLSTAPGLEMVFGSRVRLLGRAIRRRPIRHYLGRCFATLASVALGLPIYDTQCGAKIFRGSPALKEVLAEPFVSQWIFDVEIIARFLRLKGRAFCCEAIYEFPLHVWCDVGGSKVRASDFLGAIVDLIRIRQGMGRQSKT